MRVLSCLAKKMLTLLLSCPVSLPSRHCVDESHCPGPQCQKRWQKRLHRGPDSDSPAAMAPNMLMSATPSNVVPGGYPQQAGLLGLASLSQGTGAAATSATADATQALTSLVNPPGAAGAASSAPTLTALNSASKAQSPLTTTSANALHAVAQASAAAAAAGGRPGTIPPMGLYQNMDAYTLAGVSSAAANGAPGQSAAFAPTMLNRAGSLGAYHPPGELPKGATAAPSSSPSGAAAGPATKRFQGVAPQYAGVNPAAAAKFAQQAPSLSSLSAAAMTAPGPAMKK
jgi:hypothetical protein